MSDFVLLVTTSLVYLTLLAMAQNTLTIEGGMDNVANDNKVDFSVHGSKVTVKFEDRRFECDIDHFIKNYITYNPLKNTTTLLDFMIGNTMDSYEKLQDHLLLVWKIAVINEKIIIKIPAQAFEIDLTNYDEKQQLNYYMEKCNKLEQIITVNDLMLDRIVISEFAKHCPFKLYSIFDFAKLSVYKTITRDQSEINWSSWSVRKHASCELYSQCFGEVMQQTLNQLKSIYYETYLAPTANQLYELFEFTPIKAENNDEYVLQIQVIIFVAFLCYTTSSAICHYYILIHSLFLHIFALYFPPYDYFKYYLSQRYLP